MLTRLQSFSVMVATFAFMALFSLSESASADDWVSQCTKARVSKYGAYLETPIAFGFDVIEFIAYGDGQRNRKVLDSDINDAKKKAQRVCQAEANAKAGTTVQTADQTLKVTPAAPVAAAEPAPDSRAPATTNIPAK